MTIGFTTQHRVTHSYITQVALAAPPLGVDSIESRANAGAEFARSDHVMYRWSIADGAGPPGSAEVSVVAESGKLAGRTSTAVDNFPLLSGE